MSWLLLFWLLFKASLFSTSGIGNLPILHADLLALGWATEQQFAEALAIGQVTPGPSGLWVISLAYLVDGPRGAFLSLVAITLPPLAVLLVDGFHRRYGEHPATQGFVRGLALAVNGIFLTVLLGIMRGNGVDVTSIAIMLGAVALGATRRVPVLVVLALAGLAGALLY
jgi:chromate transporter